MATPILTDRIAPGGRRDEISIARANEIPGPANRQANGTPNPRQNGKPLKTGEEQEVPATCETR